MRGRKLLQSLLALAIGVSAALLLAEVALRVFSLAPSGGVFTVTEKEFHRVPGMYGPNQRVVDRRIPVLAHLVTIDSLGYRGPGFPRDKPPGEYRILLVGDSFVYGDMVDDEETLSAQLERALASSCTGVRVINAGLHGSSIIDQKHVTERSLQLSPDHVLLMFSENDVPDIAYNRLWEQLATNRAMKSRFPLSVAYPILRETALWNFGLKATLSVRFRRAQETFPRHGNDTTEVDLRDRLRGIYRDTLVAVRDTLAGRGVDLTFLVFPDFTTLYGRNPNPQAFWADTMARREEIVALDALPVLRATGLPDTALYLLPHDGHGSPRAYAVVAEHVAGELLRSGRLARNCTGAPPQAVAAGSTE